MFRPTNPPIHPPTHQKKHPPMGGEFSTDSKSFKRNRNISIRSSLIAFLLIWGVPPWWVGGWGGGVGFPPKSHVCTYYVHTHACARTCTHTCMHVKHDKHGCLHGGGHLQFPNMFILAFHACACMHMHVHMSRDTPHAPRCPPTHLPPPQSRREPRDPKSPKVYKS